MVGVAIVGKSGFTLLHVMAPDDVDLNKALVGLQSVSWDGQSQLLFTVVTLELKLDRNNGFRSLTPHPLRCETIERAT